MTSSSSLQNHERRFRVKNTIQSEKSKLELTQHVSCKRKLREAYAISMFSADPNRSLLVFVSGIEFVTLRCQNLGPEGGEWSQGRHWRDRYPTHPLLPVSPSSPPRLPFFRFQILQSYRERVPQTETREFQCSVRRIWISERFGEREREF